MNLQMDPLVIVGLKRDLQCILHTLHRVGSVQIDELASTPEVSARPLSLDRDTLRGQDELNFLVAQIDGLLETLGCRASALVSGLQEGYQEEARTGIGMLMPKVQSLTSKRDKLRDEQASLPRYEATLRKLLPIIPASAHQPGNVSVGVLVSRSHVGVLDSIASRILEMTGGRAEVVASDVDSATRAMLIVFPEDYTNEIESLLGREDVSRLRLPAELGSGPPDAVLATLHRRMASIPDEIKALERELEGLSVEWCDRLSSWSAAIHDEIEACRVIPRFGETDMTFVLTGWVPRRDYEKVQNALSEAVGEAVLIQQLPLSDELKKRAPVILQNPRPARPFESLVKLLALPRYGHIDPTCLMAIFMPIFFGMTLGDVGYGTLILGISLFIRSKLEKGVFKDILTILAMGAGWTIVFGFLYGEAFGTLGEELGMHAIWFDRASEEYVAGLLLMALAVGATHITLGLVLGVWEAVRDKSRGHLLERGGMLIGLVSLFLLVGVLTKYLPDEFMTPAIAGLIVGVAILSSSLGWLGILMGPIEFIGLIGNVLSYLRIAAVGLASVYLAKVANDMAGMIGNIVVGLVVALLIHSLNLVLGAFSPTIHSLRLHYVEFFRKFYEGGGRPYEPFRSQLKSQSLE